MKSIAYLRYVLDEMEALPAVKLKYLGEKVLKAPVVQLNRLCGLHLPLPYLLREDYVVRNRYGTWRIRHGSDFVRFAKQMIAKDIRVNGEFYVCPVFNQLIQAGLDVYVSEIAPRQMHGLGTPEDLETFVARRLSVPLRVAV